MRSRPARARASIRGARSAKTLARIVDADRDSARKRRPDPCSETELQGEFGRDTEKNPRRTAEGPLELYAYRKRNEVSHAQAKPGARRHEDRACGLPRVFVAMGLAALIALTV